MDSFRFDKVGPLLLLRCLPLERVGFRHAFSTRSGGVSPLPVDVLHLGMTEADREDARVLIGENRRRFLASLALDDWTLQTASQVHSATVKVITCRAPAGEGLPTADALVTQLPRVALGIQAADCLSLLIADPIGGAVAAVHAGWRGTVGKIVARTLETMQQSCGTDPADVLVALGPAIGPCCFEVGNEVIEQFETINPRTRTHLLSAPRADGKAHLDLNLANCHQLIEAGVPSPQIYDCKYCTVCHNDLFFSYRAERGKERPVGRHLAIIGRPEPDTLET
jgi:YfiH family protein